MIDINNLEHARNSLPAVSMAIGPLVIPLIIAGATIAGAVGSWATARKNRKSQEQQNEKDRQWQQQQYDIQRKHALEDYARQNEYNDPMQQMARLRQAGLNPHLIYGKGAETTAAQIRQAQPSGGEQPAPKMETGIGQEIGHGLKNYLDMKQGQVQTEQTQQSISLLRAQETKTVADTAKIIQDTARTKFDLQQAQELKDSVMLRADLQNRAIATDIDKKRVDIQFRLDENERQTLKNTSDIEVNVQRIIQSKVATALENEKIIAMRFQNEMNPIAKEKLQLEVEKARKEIALLETANTNAQYAGKIKEVEAKLAAKGLTFYDDIGWRMAIDLLTR